MVWMPNQIKGKTTLNSDSQTSCTRKDKIYLLVQDSPIKIKVMATGEL